MTDRIFYGHSNALDKSNWQMLRDHLSNTARIASQLGEDAGLSTFAYWVGLLHDLGKYSLAFQHRLEGGPKVDHTTAGAQGVVSLMGDDPQKRIIGALMAYCIAGHHGGLPDYGSPADVDTDPTLRGRLKKKVEDYRSYEGEIDIAPLKELPLSFPFRPIRNHEGFSIAFFTRMLYSTLVDADFIETETFMQGAKKPRGELDPIPVLVGRFNHFLEQFANPQNPIHQRRTQILNACRSRASDQPGFFKLTVPTGGGKTYASMAFALNHALANGMKRVIYVIPYTSIIEQNAALFKESLGEENVLEHHSNFDWDARKNRVDEQVSDENLTQKLKLAAENWDAPIIVTTNVQFFESLFANRSSRCRKLHNLARSVIIFDEAQMLPREYLQPCMYAVHELVRNYKATAVFCTATQPSLERFLPDPKQVMEIAPEPQALYRFFKRVDICHLGRLTDEGLIRRINQHAQALCIVNTRRHARGLFLGLKGEGCFHLSTLMYPAHRRQVIREIRERLASGQPCQVISTQIMEAGIDVDFPVGFRSLSGLDSIIQAAGRVNREGKNSSGNLFVFEPDSEFVRRTPAYIRQGVEVANTVFRKHPADPAGLEAIAAFYNQLYSLQDKKAFDSRNILGRFELDWPGAVFEFETAAKECKLIDDDTTAVVVPREPAAMDLVEQARTDEFPLRLSRKLQAYTVNIYDQEFEALQACGGVDVVNDTFNVLGRLDLYDEKTGLQIPENRGGDAIFVGM